MESLVVVTDFDGTLMEQDVGDVIMERLGVLERPESIESSKRYLRKEIGSMEWLQINYPFLQGEQHKVDQILQQIEPRKGATDFLQFCRDQEIPVTILSDGMQYYIRQLLQIHNLQANVVISNPIDYSHDGQLQLGFQNSNPACKWCGCCKASVVRSMKQRARGQRIVYIGDGTSDYYGSSFADWIFARGTLANYLDQEGSSYYPFETFYDVIRVLKPALEQFRQGTADRRVQGGNVFCKFD